MRVSLAGVDDREPPVTERERYLLDAQREKIDQHRRLGRAVERGQLIEQPSLRPDPFALHASAQLRERGSVELVRGLAAVPGRERDERERQRHLERGRGGEARTGRNVAGDLEPRADEREPSACELGDGAPHVAAPPLCASGVCKREFIALAEVARVRSHAIGGARCAGPRAHRDARGDRERQREAVVVVGVLADQVDAARSERAAALTGHGRSPRAGRPRTPRAPCRR